MKYVGDLPDNRSPKEHLKDYTTEELDFGTQKPVTKKQAIKNAKKYISRDQKNKQSCVPSSICNALWNTEKVELADEFLYTLRANKPMQGCYWGDIADKVIKLGVCKREKMKEVFTEKEANAIVPNDEQYLDAQIHKQKSYVYVTNWNDFVYLVNSGLPIAFSIFAEEDEWSREVPEVYDINLTYNKAYINHAVCAIPNTWYKDKGEEYFIITDSAKFGNKTLRHISKEFFDFRYKHGLYFEDLYFNEKGKWQTPKEYKGYEFKRDLSVGSRGQDVRVLQELLKYNGYLTILQTTDFFGGMTLKAVKDFQADYPTILQSVGLTQPTGNFGKFTRNQMNLLLK